MRIQNSGKRLGIFIALRPGVRLTDYARR
jgi:hypothetical protein